jgi:predicted nuclease with TOPRIM domain
MKERCRQLQARLTVVERENLQLKIEKQRQIRQENKQSAVNVGEVDKLHEQIAQLSRTKSQLTHHIYMVATENKYLWTKLSILTEANESLGTRLNKISTALNSHTNKSEQLLQEVDYGNNILVDILVVRAVFQLIKFSICADFMQRWIIKV